MTVTERMRSGCKDTAALSFKVLEVFEAKDRPMTSVNIVGALLEQDILTDKRQVSKTLTALKTTGKVRAVKNGKISDWFLYTWFYDGKPKQEYLDKMPVRKSSK